MRHLNSIGSLTLASLSLTQFIRLMFSRCSVIYNVTEDSEEGLVLEEGQVLAGVFGADGSQLVVKSDLSTDGGRTSLPQFSSLFHSSGFFFFFRILFPHSYLSPIPVRFYPSLSYSFLVLIYAGKAWEQVLEGNSMSFEGIYDSNAEAQPLLLEGVMASAHDTVWKQLSGKVRRTEP